jgi:hypothetical protein
MKMVQGKKKKNKEKKRGDETTDPNWYSEAFHPNFWICL